MKKIPIAFTERQYNLLHDEKKKSGCSIGSIIRASLEKHFREQEASS